MENDSVFVNTKYAIQNLINELVYQLISLGRKWLPVLLVHEKINKVKCLV